MPRPSAPSFHIALPRAPEIPTDEQHTALEKAASRNGNGGEASRRAAIGRLDPTSLRLFIAVAEEGTVAAAAKREHLVGTAVSRRIARLEDALHAQLMSRTNKGLQPTPAGEVLIKLARKVLMDLDDLYVQMHEYSSGIRGHVKLAANISAMTEFLPAEIKSFLARHPHIQIDLEECNSTGVARAVAENAAHIGILTMGAVHRFAFETYPYHTHELVVVVPNGHPLASRASVSFEETLPYEYVGLPNGSAIGLQLLQAAAEIGRPLKLRIQVTSYDSLCRMVEAGLGIGVVPRSAAELYVDGQRVCAISLDERWASRELRICVRSAEALPVAARLLVEHLRQPIQE